MERGKKRNDIFWGSVYTAGGCAVLLFGTVASNIQAVRARGIQKYMLLF